MSVTMWQPLNSSTSPSTSLSTRPRCMTSASRVTASRGTLRWKQWSGDFWRLGENLEPFQAYELHLAGWNFQVTSDLNLLNLLIILPWKYVPTIKCFSSKVLSPVFTVHWGLAKKKGRPTWRERFFFKCVFLIDFFSPRQNSNNRKRFPHFKKELYARFSNLPEFPIFPTIFETNDKSFWFSHPANILFSKVQPWLCQGVGSGAGGDQGRAREDDEEVQAGEGSSQTNEKSRGLSRKNNCYRNKLQLKKAMIQNCSVFRKLSDWVQTQKLKLHGCCFSFWLLQMVRSR